MTTGEKSKYVFSLLALWITLYYGVQSLIIKNQYNFLTPLDESIPLLPDFIWVYHSLIPMILVTTIGIIKNKTAFFTTFFSCLIATFILHAFYIMFPAFYPREVIELETISLWLIQITREIDGAHNTFPSGHVTFSWIMYLSASKCLLLQRTKFKFIKIIYFLWAVAISLSTLFLKQHFIIDVFSGVLMAFLCYNISRYFIDKIARRKNEQRKYFLFK